MNVLIQLGLGVVLSALIAFVAYRRESLSRNGVVGAIVVGTIIFGLGGWVWGLVLITFFVLSSLLSHYKEADKAQWAEKFAKGHRRDLGQTLANGGAGALIALAHFFYPNPALMAAFVGAIATVNADTWATEIGVLSKYPPRLVTTWRQVERGASGGVSALGTLSALAGALMIGLAALGLLALDGMTGQEMLRQGGLWLVLAATLSGWAGSLFDSLLGATVQAIYYCPTCQKETEKSRHTCGTLTHRTRGWQWLNNDWVNFISSIAGALTTAGIGSLFAR